jgi:hypothetical protein
LRSNVDIRGGKHEFAAIIADARLALLAWAGPHFYIGSQHRRSAPVRAGRS